MRRGEVWTVAGGRGYAGKPRPAVILQDDRFDATASITLCAFTTDPTDAPLFRLLIEPNATNGLRAPCRLMVDKITTVAKSRVGSRIGRLDDQDILRLNRAVLVFLGLAGPSTQSQILVPAGTVILLPIILGYTAVTYYVFRGKVRPGEGYH